MSNGRLVMTWCKGYRVIGRVLCSEDGGRVRVRWLSIPFRGNVTTVEASELEEV